jgi:hypothetical protein
MKRKLFALVLICLSVGSLKAQNTDLKKLSDVKYRRSSLHTILLESEKFPFKDTVIKAYYNAPFPDKYNNHTIGEKSFDPSLYGTVSGDSANYKETIDNYFKQKKVANQLVAKWFNRQEDGSFNMDLIGERGEYNASEMEANIAQSSARGVSALADAGEELINNTFVVVSRLNFVSNEIAAAVARDIAKAAANNISNSMVREIALAAADAAYEKGKEGFSVWTTAYLYRLSWNDSIAAVFYNDMWMDKSNIDPAKKELFDNTDLFSLEFIGDEKATSLVTFSLKEKRTEEKIVEISTIRNIDAVYAKLQKKYDVFKTKTPLYTGYPITAKIGLKEGIEKGDKYEVLEQVIDNEGRTKYVRKGVIEVDKSQIWDNRFSPIDEQPQGDAAATDTAKIDRTLFKGAKNYYSGMLIRQIN